jgi:hypothetical protein
MPLLNPLSSLSFSFQDKRSRQDLQDPCSRRRLEVLNHHRYLLSNSLLHLLLQRAKVILLLILACLSLFLVRQEEEKEGEMGEAETKKSRGASCSALHNWMGEPSDQGEDEKTLELSLGLPGGSGGQASWKAAASKNKGRHSADADDSMLSLGGYSAAVFAPRSHGTVVWMLKPNVVLDLIALHYEILAHSRLYPCETSPKHE